MPHGTPQRRADRPARRARESRCRETAVTPRTFRDSFRWRRTLGSRKRRCRRTPPTGRMPAAARCRVGERAAERRIDAIETHSGDRASPAATAPASTTSLPDPPPATATFDDAAADRRNRRQRHPGELASPAECICRLLANAQNALVACGDRSVSAVEVAPFGVQPERRDRCGAVGIECEERADTAHAARRCGRTSHAERRVARRSPRRRPASARVRAFRRGRAADRPSPLRAPPTASGGGARSRGSTNADVGALVVTRAAA